MDNDKSLNQEIGESIIEKLIDLYSEEISEYIKSKKDEEVIEGKKVDEYSQICSMCTFVISTFFFKTFLQNCEFIGMNPSRYLELINIEGELKKIIGKINEKQDN